MGVSDPQFKRLKLMLIVFLTIIAIYSCELVFFGSSKNVDMLHTMVVNVPKLSPPNLSIWVSITVVIGLITGFFIFIFQVLTFTLPAIPLWMTIVMFPIMGVLFLTSVYFVYDFAYDFIKALPFT